MLSDSVLVDLAAVVILLLALVLVAHSAVSLQQTLYIWNHPDRVAHAAAPETREPPTLGFTVLLPARHEQAVIGETLRRLGDAEYPRELVELMVICSEDDTETIAAAEAAKAEHGLDHVTVLVFGGTPGKSKAMNLGLAAARFDVLTIFDSEDDVSPDLFSIANTILVRTGVNVLQGGVQLMDFDSHWFSSHNVLEYFFWFKSRMHFYAKRGSVPLGGNTVFFRREDLDEVGGWDEVGLTEDADIGIRLSLAGKRFGVVYDPRHVTKEEVPHSTRAFVKQRTRWIQGFIQILRKGEWWHLPLRHRMLIGYVLTAPLYMASVLVMTPLLILLGATTRLPVAISLFSYVPLLLAVVMLVVSVLGLFEFGRDQGVRVRPHHYLVLLVTFLPYQVLLAVSAVRAGWREVRGVKGWEKTVHTGAHRNLVATAAPAIAMAADQVSVEGRAA